jgi:predicted nucleotidyltransferase
MLEKVEAKYGLKLPKKVITIDYGDDVGDLFVRFHHADNTEGEATADGKVIVHYDQKRKIVAIEIMDGELLIPEEKALKKQEARKRVKTLEGLKAQLHQLKPVLQEKYGVETIGIFGSYCRGEQTEKSDLDILIEYSAGARGGLFKLLELEEFLTNKLGVKADLGTKKSLKPHIGECILQEVVYVFSEPVRVKADRKWGSETFLKSGEATFGE